MDTQSLFSLEGRTALVTGGSRGIGKMIASGFIGQGAKVYISSRKAEACEAVAEELGPNCIAVPQDISTVEGCKALAATMAEREDGIDVLVNNVGWDQLMFFTQTTPEFWQKIIQINYVGVLNCTKCALDIMIPKSTGAIVSISSDASRSGEPRVPSPPNWFSAKLLFGGEYVLNP